MPHVGTLVIECRRSLQLLPCILLTTQQPMPRSAYADGYICSETLSSCENERSRYALPALNLASLSHLMSSCKHTRKAKAHSHQLQYGPVPTATVTNTLTNAKEIGVGNPMDCSVGLVQNAKHAQSSPPSQHSARPAPRLIGRWRRSCCCTLYGQLLHRQRR